MPIMKSKFLLGLTFIVCLLITSCSTSTKVALRGKPGTEIYQINGQYVGAIPVSGELRLKIPDENYQAFMLSKKQGEGTRIPFALNYKNKGHAGAKIAKYVGMMVSFAGDIAVLAGGIIWAADEESSAGPVMTLGGLGGAVGGIAIGMPASYRLEQDAYKYNYQYLPYQSTNEDMVFTKPVISYAANEPDKPAVKLRPARQAAEDTPKQASGTQKVKRDLGINTKKIQGEYVGTGTIKLGDETMETLKGVTIEIKRVDSSLVTIDIIEADGNNFFGTTTKYKAAKNGKDGIMLNHHKIPDAIISIDKNGSLEYYNPSLEIDGTVYTFIIKAEKQ